MPVCEDLATKIELTEVKEELQELREQLNTVLGEKEDGGTEILFKKGKDSGLITAALAVTALGATKIRAATAIQDIILANPSFEPIFKDFANGNAKWTAVKGGGTRTPLPDLTKASKVAGTGAVGATTTAKVGAVGASGAALAMFVGNLMASVGLSLANLKITGMYAEVNQRAIATNESVYNGLVSFLSRQNNSIDQANAQILQTQAELVEQAAETEVVNQQIELTQADVAKVNEQIKQAEERASQIEAEIESFKTEVSQLEVEGIEGMVDIETALNFTQSQVSGTKDLITQTNARVEVVEKELVLVKEQIADQELRIEKLETTTQLWYQEFQKLKLDLEEDRELTEVRVSLLEAKLVIAESKLKTSSGGGSSLPSLNASAGTQTALLELASQLSDTTVDIPTITPTDIVNQPGAFRDAFDELLPQLQPGGNVNQEQLDGLRDDFKVDVKDALNLALATLIIPELTDIKDKTSERKIADATKTGICESLNGGSCPATPANPNQVDGLKGLKDQLANTLNDMSGLLGLANLGANQTILGVVKNTNEAVRNTKYGLEKIQGFAETAWKVTQADKVMSAITLVLTVHNGMMLSNNLLSTISEALNVTLEALNIKDETDNSIDLGKLVKEKMTSILTAILGEEKYKELTTRIAKANRIYQASVNVLDTTRSLFDSARTIAELTAENTGKIGNALRESGAVYEDSYGDFLEKVNPQNAAMRKLERFRQGLGTIEEGVSTVSEISSEVVETKENFTQLKKEKEAWKKEVDEAVEDKRAERVEAKAELQVLADIDDLDFDTAPNQS